MMKPETFKKRICADFCTAVEVQPVAAGLAVSTVFDDPSGDPITFYLTEAEDGYRVEDDGSYLAHLIASDIPIDQGPRGQLLDAILGQAGAHWDRETYEIRSDSFPEAEVVRRAAAFMSSLVRVRDLELLTRDMVRSTFRQDAVATIARRFDAVSSIEEGAVVADGLSEFPADLVIRPHATSGAIPAAVYLVSSNDRLNEALILQMEADRFGRNDFAVVALIEDSEMRQISRHRFQRAQNRSLSMPIFRGDEGAAMNLIAQRMRLFSPAPTAH